MSPADGLLYVAAGGRETQLVTTLLELARRLPHGYPRRR